MKKDERAHIGECAHPDTKFKGNPNLAMTGGVVPFQVQHGQGNSNPGMNKSGHAKGHSSS